MMKTYPMVSFRCNTQLHKTIQREAKRRKMNVSEFIKEAVTFHLDNLNDHRRSFDQ